jgi:hypothetical protein
MKHVVNGTPIVLGTALIVPAGLMAKLRGDQPADPVAASVASDPSARSRIERLAMDAVRRAEEARGCRVVDVSGAKCGWDLTSYPIHPEVFDRLYEDWTTIDGFQRTRGVLKLMAKTIYRLWKDDNRDLMILPGSLPLHDGSSRNELTYYLTAGWDAVIERDIDGDRAETTELEGKEPRFGQVGAARRVARTIFLATAPASVATKGGTRGIDRARVVLGCLQPDQSSAVYSDALNRLADRLHYLNSSGDKAQESTRFWFDTRANLRREMEDRKRRFDDRTEVRGRIADSLKRVGGAPFFDGVHIFTPHADVPDDTGMRLVVLPPDSWYSRDESRPAFDAVLIFVRNNGTKPRYRANRLLFLAADHGALSRLSDAARVALAWGSIVDDVKEGRLNIDLLQKNQAEKELKAAEEVLPRAARECYKWLLCPVQESPASSSIEVEAFPLNTTGGSVGGELERVSTENELVIATWSPIHLRTKLQELYWKDGRIAASASAFFEDTLRYLYMPRFRNRDVLGQAIRGGAVSRDFFGIAYGQDGEKLEGFQFGAGNVIFDDTLLLIEPSAAGTYETAHRPQAPTPGGTTTPTPGGATGTGTTTTPVGPTGGSTTGQAKPRAFHASAVVPAATAKMRLVEIAEEIVSVLASDPNANVRLSVEIAADFPEGASDSMKRAVSENARSLGISKADWE